ncbi:MAG: TIM-barrel domain-containing protein [Candidatus Bipolaricaulota bacterium]
MNVSHEENFKLELEGLDRKISRLSVSTRPEEDYVNDLIPPVEVEEKVGKAGWELSRTSDGFTVEYSGSPVAKFTELSEVSSDRVDGQNNGQWLRLVHKLADNSRVFGLGEKTGYLEKSGRVYEMWNRDTNGFYTHNEDPLYSSIPFYIVQEEGIDQTRNFIGVYLHQAERSRFNVKNGERMDGVGITVFSPKATLYLIAGEEIKQVVKGYTRLTGKPLLPPKWALGYHHSKYGAPGDREEALKIAKDFRRRGIPCDALYFDIQHMDSNKDFTWDEARFPEPESLIDQLHEMDYRVVNIVDPGIKEEEGYEVYDSGKENDVFVKDLEGEDFSGSVWAGFCVFPDFIRKDARDWWASQNEKLLDQGVDGIWNDMNEPAIFFGEKQIKRIASELEDKISNEDHLGLSCKQRLASISENNTNSMVHESEEGEKVDHQKVHNLYALYEAVATEQAFERKRPNRRPFILTRSGFSGIQKYAAKWTGDNSSTWEHMRMSIYMSLNLGLSGLPLVGPDIGGFDGDVEPELLTRWIQLGSVLPFFRNHSSLDTTPQEPWSFGEKYEDINRKYISLRYRLLPFLYTEFFRTHRSGIPVMRPLFMEFPADEETYSVSDQFLIGDSMLVAPVVERGSERRLVYLPYEDGNREISWLDWWTGNRLESGYNVLEAPLEVMPILVREGKGIPYTAPVQHTGEVRKELNIKVNPGSGDQKEVQVPIYDDDGDTKGYEQGNYFYGEFIIEESGEGTALELEVKHDGYEPFWSEIEVINPD